MSDTSWMLRFKPEKPGDEDWLAAMRLIYYRSDDDQADNESAFALLLSGAEKGNSRCAYRLAECYESGYGVPRDVAKGWDWRAKARAIDENNANWRAVTWQGDFKEHCRRHGLDVVKEIESLRRIKRETEEYLDFTDEKIDEMLNRLTADVGCAQA